MSEHNELPDFPYGPHYKHTTHDWMSNVSALDILTLGELVLPGAHNAGVDKKADYAAPGVVAHLAACQNNSFLTQLNDGARALDIRLEQDKKGNFWCQHNGWRSSRALEDLIMAVDRFLTANPNEFIVLDFHELNSGQYSDVDEFSRMMLTHLGKRMIPTLNSYLTLGELKKISGLQRVMVATPDGVDRRHFNYKISHQWSGINSASTAELQRFIGQVMQNPPQENLPWSLSATSYILPAGPRDISKNLNEWFDPSRSDWASKCSIINVDFFEEFDLVMFCRTASIAKARAKRAELSPADGIPK